MTEKKSRKIIIYIVTGLVVFFLGAMTMYGIFYFFPSTIGTVVTKLEKDVTVTESGIADAVEKVYDSVVVVRTYINGQEYAQGTGFVYKTEGDKAYILTNNHVINNATEVYVTFTDSSIVKTKIVGADVYSDIAVLSVDADHIISVASLGSSENARVGDTAFAIGAPIDSAFSWSVSRGIVSGKNRLVEVELSSGNTSTPMVVNTIQTDAAINEGNSGGPLANSNGEVIGITSIKLASEKIEGMGFAIPIETALAYAEELIKGDEVRRPFLGVTMLDVSTVLANYYYSREYYQYYSLINEAKVTTGVIITDVEKGSSAANAKVQANDIITKVDGKDCLSVGYLRYYLYSHNVGDEMTLTVIRDNREIDIKVKLTSN